MPLVAAGIGVHRDDGRQEQVVTIAVRVAYLGVPGRAVAHSQQHLVVDVVVDNGIPDRTATAVGDPSAGITPGVIGQARQSFVADRAVGRLVRVRHGIKTPDQFTGIGVIGGNVTTHAQFGAAVANHDLVLHNPGGAGDGVGLALVNGHHAPDHLTGLGIQSLQAAVEHPDKDLAFIDGQPAVNHVATALGGILPGYLRVIDPDFFPGARVQGVDHRPGAGDVHHAVHHDRRRLNTPGLFHVIDPANAQVRQGIAVDFGQGGVAGLVVGTAVGEPLFWLFRGSVQSLLVYRRNRGLLGRRRRLVSGSHRVVGVCGLLTAAGEQCKNEGCT